MLRWLLPLLSGIVISRGVPWGLPAAPAAVVRPAAEVPTLRADAPTLARQPAAAVAVVDPATGSWLYRQASDRALPLASLTKLMTVLVVLEARPSWPAVVQVQPADLRVGGRQWLQAGDRVTVEDLFQLTLLASSNEAAVALARSTGLTAPAFVAAMNRRAGALGLRSLQFADPAGLEPANVGSAQDVAQLTYLALQEERIRQALIRPSYRFTLRGSSEQREASATNSWLLTGNLSQLPMALVGAKTGYLDEAGYNFAGVVEHAGRRISVVLLGVPSEEERWQAVQAITRWVFSSYEWPPRGG